MPHRTNSSGAIDQMRRIWLRGAGSATALAALGSPLAAGGQGRSATAPVGRDVAQARTFAQGFAYPWGLCALPDGRWLVTEKPGRLRIVSADGRQRSAPVSGLPAVDGRGQGGLFDVVIDPDYASNRHLYLSYAEPGTGADASKNGTAVARAELSADGSALHDLRVVFRQTPKVASTGHFGGRLVFARDGRLFVTLGDRQSQAAQAQNPANHLGKVVRIEADGGVPPDNPWAGKRDAAPELWSLGHRNVQGAALHPVTGELWICEHGPQGGDEINIARAGRNYGWPLISYGCEYGARPIDRCPTIGGATTEPGLEQPLTYWVPLSIAPSGLVFYTADLMPAWKGSLFLGALAGAALWRVGLNGNGVTAREALFGELGERIRAVKQGPDGALYLLTDSAEARMLRIAPAG